MLLYGQDYGGGEGGRCAGLKSETGGVAFQSQLTLKIFAA